jgi:hypothetical protein
VTEPGPPPPWVAPDAPPPGPGGPGPAGPPVPVEPGTPPTRPPGPARRPSAPDGPAPPVPLRRLAPSDLLDGAFAVLKASPANVLAVAALFVVPVQLVAAWLQRDALGALNVFDALAGDEAAIEALEEDDLGATAAGLLGLMGMSISLPFVCAATTALVLARHRGHDPSLGELVGTVVRKAPILLVAWVLVHVAEVLGLFLCGVGALAAMTLFLVTAPAVVAEDLGPVAAMRRSARLARRRFWPTLGVAMLTGIVASLFDQALSSAPVLLAVLVGTDGAGWLLLGAGGVMSSIVTTPVVAAATTLYYLDLRVRTEGLDLELEAAAVLEPAP